MYELGFIYFFNIGLELICNAALVSAVQQTESVIHVPTFFSLFPK